MKKWLSILLAGVLATSMVACSPKEEAPAATDGGGEATMEEKAEMPKIGVTIYKFDDNFMSFVRRSITTAGEGKAELILNDSQNNQATQNDQVDMMISKGVKSLAINLVDPQAASTIISKAQEEDLPVVFFNKEPSAEDLKSYDKAWYVGTTSSESGIIQGEMMAEMWNANAAWDRNGDGVLSYVLMKGEPGHPDAEARTKYAVDTLVEKGIEVEELELQTGMWDSVKGKELMDAWLAKHGEAIEVVICNNDAMALGAVQSLNANGYFEGDMYMPVFGVDAIPDALEQIKAGFMAGTVLNDAKNQGQATFDLANNVAVGNDPLEGTEWTFDENKAVRVPYVAITVDNIEFAEKAYE
jgi:methyl-galactoside transport system substrate-binding protein